MPVQSQLGTAFPMTVLPDTGTPMVTNGVITAASSSTVQSDYPSTSVTPTAAFTFEWKGQAIEFAVGVSVPVEAALLTALQAANAPVTQP